MKRLVMGILAHVDAGKTTLSEAILYGSGALRKAGRVDHGDAFFDTDPLERERGITIRAKSTVFRLGEREAFLLDTPGHVDFSTEAERVLRVLDCAVLVISSTDGVQAHTLTLWRLLERFAIPVFVFVNKTDLPGMPREGLMSALKEKLDGGCMDFSGTAEELAEEIALCDETLLERYLESGRVTDEDCRELIAKRKLFPCCFGSALKGDGVEEFLGILSRLAPVPAYPLEFGARAFKVAYDDKGNRLTWLKVTGGTLKAKSRLTNAHSGEAGEVDVGAGEVWEEKADQIRVYKGVKFETVEEMEAGGICAVTGLTRTRAGDGFGIERDDRESFLEPVFRYQAFTPGNADPRKVLEALRRLEEEEPSLRVEWDAAAQSVQVRLMGEIQAEILKRRLQERFRLNVEFGAGAIVYRETIAAPVEGVGHFEPLRHYAEVRLLLEPLPPGSGIRYASVCPEDRLSRNWQRLILTHLAEREHVGVLTGSPVTDIRFTLLNGRAHEKHTEGGDFREAVYRAVRQGLMSAQSVLLEPWYSFRLEVPANQSGRAASDIRRMGGESVPPETLGETALLTGEAPAAALKDYAKEVAAYTHGLGQFSCQVSAFRPCGNQADIVARIGYDPERDIENPAGSVFCAHGAGYVVAWERVPEMAHTERVWRPEKGSAARPGMSGQRSAGASGDIADKELQAIFERTYGPVKARREAQIREARREPPERARLPRQPTGPEYLLVDGYNIIFAWEDLKAVALGHLDAARKILCDSLCDYQSMRGCVVIAVFDAYKVKGNPGSHERYHNIDVVYTKEAETADTYIERATYEIGKEHKVRVATSDGPEQLIILGHGALRVSASMFREEMEAARVRIAELIARNNRAAPTGAIRAAMEAAANARAAQPDTNAHAAQPDANARAAQPDANANAAFRAAQARKSSVVGENPTKRKFLP